jgi:uncharacterized protein YjbI with pentapeptide repeats
MPDKPNAPPGVDWRGADMRNVNMSGINLEGADLRAADLSGANFTGSNLRYADFRGARLQGTNFQNASLYGAKMQGVEAHQANLGGAYLDGAMLPPPVAEKQARPSPGELATMKQPLQQERSGGKEHGQQRQNGRGS